MIRCRRKISDAEAVHYVGSNLDDVRDFLCVSGDEHRLRVLQGVVSIDGIPAFVLRAGAYLVREHDRLLIMECREFHAAFEEVE